MIFAIEVLPFRIMKFHSPHILFFWVIGSALIVSTFVRWQNRNEMTFIDGAEKVATTLRHNLSIHSLAVYHEDYPHESYVPQLNYYTEGWLLGWNKNRTSMTKTWNEIDSLAQKNVIPKTDAAIVYVNWDSFYKPTQEEKDRISRINQNLSAHYGKILHSKKYQLYWEPK
jgi:hypothetical protein